MPGRIEFEFTTRSNSGRAPHSESTPLRILLLGNFSGHGSARTRPPVAQRRLHAVDLDSLDQVLGRIAPELTLDAGDGTDVRISFSELDDFHPDRLLRRLPQFVDLLAVRARLHDQNSYTEAAAQLRTLLAQQAPAAEQRDAPEPDTTAESDSATLARLLGKSAGGTGQAPDAARSSVDRLIQAAIGAHIVPEPDAGQQVYFDALDAALGERMRAILRHPEFQALESLWRGAAFLVSRLELDEQLQLMVLDVTKQELAVEAAQAAGDPRQCGLYHLLVEQGMQDGNTEPAPLIIGQYSFDHSADDIALLEMLGTIAARAGGPFLAQADSALVGCAALAETPDPRDWTAVDSAGMQRWNALRTGPVAPWLGLVLPRMLLRLPYGPQTDEIDGFEFDEIGDTPAHAQFLWGNPALACAALIGQAFTDSGWEMTPGDVRDLGSLPAYIHTVDGERRLLPCAEIFLTETAADRLMAQGLMPLVSLRNTDTVRLLRFQSVASPAQALAGAWQ